MADGTGPHVANTHNHDPANADGDFGALFPVNLGPRLLLPAAMDLLLVAVLVMPVALARRMASGDGNDDSAWIPFTFLGTQATHLFVSSDGVQISATLLLGAGVSSWASAFKRYSRDRGTAQEAIGSLTWHEAQHIFMAIGVISVFLGVHALSVLNGPIGGSATDDAAPIGVLLTAVMSCMAWYPTLKARAMYLVDTPEPTRAKTVARRKLEFALQKAGVLHRGHDRLQGQPTISPQTQHAEILRQYVARFPKDHWTGRSALANVRRQWVFWAVMVAPLATAFTFFATVMGSRGLTALDIVWAAVTAAGVCGVWAILWAVWFMRFFWLADVQGRAETIFVVGLASATVGLMCFVEASQRIDPHSLDHYNVPLAVLYFIAGFAFFAPVLSIFFSWLESIIDHTKPNLWADNSVITSQDVKVLRINHHAAYLYDMSTEGALTQKIWRPKRKQNGCLVCEHGGPTLLPVPAASRQPGSRPGTPTSSGPPATSTVTTTDTGATGSTATPGGQDDKVIRLPNAQAPNVATRHHHDDGFLFDDEDD